MFFKFILWSLGAIYLPDFSIADSNVTLPSRESVGVEEANGCEKDKDPSPDRATMEKVCHLYQFLESKHGEYKILVPGNTSRPLSSASREPLLCREYYLVFARARNVICAYRSALDAAAGGLRDRAQARFRAQLAGAREPAKNDIELLNENAEMNGRLREMHQKYLSLFEKYERWEKRLSGQYRMIPGFGGGGLINAHDDKKSRDQLAQYMLNTEMNCKGGSISNIPGLLYKVTNTRMVEVFTKSHQAMAEALAKAKALAQEGANAYGDVERNTYRARNSLQGVGVPPAASSEIPQDQKNADGSQDKKNPLAEGAIAKGLDKGAEKSAEAIAVLRGAPLPTSAKVALSFGISLSFEGIRSGIQHIDATTVLLAAIGTLGPVTAIGSAVTEAVLSNEEADRKRYLAWTSRELEKNLALGPPALSQAYCKMLEDEEAERRSVADKERERNRRRSDLISRNRAAFHQDFERLRSLRGSPGFENEFRAYCEKWSLDCKK